MRCIGVPAFTDDFRATWVSQNVDHGAIQLRSLYVRM